jgi:hypothetical protein
MIKNNQIKLCLSFKGNITGKKDLMIINTANGINKYKLSLKLLINEIPRKQSTVNNKEYRFSRN